MTLEAKFETGAPEPPFDAGTIPWAYGDDRITALVRSPDSLYVYWEITDDAIARARKRLGPAGDHGWFNLRLYDTTAREFDGINAHSYFDVTVDRETRDYFFDLRQPTASFHVEVGIKSHEGYFQPIARSGRADFPRKEPSQDRSLEWLSVTSEPHPSAKPYRSKFNPPPAPPPGASPAPTQPRSEPSGGTATLHQHSEERTFTWAHPAHVELRWEGPWLSEPWHAEWKIRWRGRPEGGVSVSLYGAPWIDGPFTEHMLDASRFEIRLLGDGATVIEEHSSGLEVFGPWQIAIKGFGPEERRTIGSWRVHWVRVEPASVETWWTAFERVRVSAWERTRVAGGASESSVHTEGGASEMWRLGASERWTLGGSEWMALGASELMWLGGSERILGGASALLFGGASNLGGASGFMLGGASNLGGSSGFTLGGASSAYMGSSSAPYGWR